MAKLNQSERLALSPGGFHRRHDMRRNDPRGRRAFDAWLSATRDEREGAGNV